MTPADSEALRVALTFDAEYGEDIPGHNIGARGWEAILDLLKARNVRATFFLQADWAAHEPALTRRTAAEGHLLGNHTLNHLRLGDHPQHLADQVDTADAVLRAVLRSDTLKPWFRLPYLQGNRDPAVIGHIRSLGWEHVDTNCDSRDWDPRCSTPEAVAENVLTCVEAGATHLVPLLHTWPAPTADAVDRILSRLMQKPVRFLTVDELTPAERAPVPIPAEYVPNELSVDQS